MTSPLFFRYLTEIDLTDEHRSNVITFANLLTPLLHWIPRGIPELTDHGLLHSTNILGYLRDLINEYPFSFSEDEKYILSLAAIFHDIGCIAGRDSHNIKTVNILKKSQFDMVRQILGPTLYRALTVVIVAHSKNYDLKDIPEDPSPDIRLDITSIIFRIADACDISASRIKELLFEILVEEDLLCEKSRNIWSSHLQIENIKINENKIVPMVYDEVGAKFCVDDLKKDLDLVNPFLIKKGLPEFVIEPMKIERDIV